jgi:hypothetical protein
MAVAAEYNESDLLVRLKVMPKWSRVWFACASAENLMPICKLHMDESGDQSLLALRNALDLIEPAGTEEASIEAVESMHCDILALKLLAEEDRSVVHRIAQNAAAATGYALTTWLTGSPQDALWAWRQLYEATDSVVQMSAPYQTYVEDDPLMDRVVSVLEETLRAVGDADWKMVLNLATRNGTQLLKVLEVDRKLI